ncbi:MAG: ATP-binding protein, partial [Actinomycetota bacterium]|nr:ATP-binding protein [Actinomycetota bacterium]
MTSSPAKIAKPNSTYGVDSITVLEGLEAVRKRPGMYIGSTSERGLHHLVWEVVDNSVDEALAGHADHVEVTLLADGGVRVKDNGRGMPVGMHRQQKKPTVEVILTILHAGGKFDGESYAVSGGLHGVGVSVVNALSSRLEVEIDRDGFHWSQPYVNQKPAEPLKQGEPTRKTGTTVTFWADAAIFETLDYNRETVSRRLQEMAFLNKGLTIVLRDERPAKIVDEDDAVAAPKPADAAKATSKGPWEIAYHYANGIADFVKHLNATKEPIHKEPIYFVEDSEDAAERMSIEIAMQWNSSYSGSVYTFANTINTVEGGTHEEGFRAALTNVVNRWAVDKKIIKDTKEDRFSGDDIREGLAAIV